MTRMLATTPPAPAPASDIGVDLIGPIAGTGIVGVVLLMVILRFKLMPAYVYDDAKKDWERERAELKADVDALKAGLAEQNEYMRTQVVPTMTRVLDAERELVDLRREEQADRRRSKEP